VRNAKGRVVHLPETNALRVTVPLEYSGAMRPLKKMFGLRSAKTYEFDPLSQKLWERLDGQRTVEQLIEEVMGKHQLTFFEARGAVGQCLAQLSQRGLIALIVPPLPEDGADKLRQIIRG